MVHYEHTFIDYPSPESATSTSSSCYRQHHHNLLQHCGSGNVSQLSPDMYTTTNNNGTPPATTTTGTPTVVHPYEPPHYNPVSGGGIDTTASAYYDPAPAYRHHYWQHQTSGKEESAAGMPTAAYHPQSWATYQLPQHIDPTNGSSEVYKQQQLEFYSSGQQGQHTGHQYMLPTGAAAGGGGQQCAMMTAAIGVSGRGGHVMGQHLTAAEQEEMIMKERQQHQAYWINQNAIGGSNCKC